MALTRVSITIPKSLVRAADKRAKELERSRSWLLVEALRRYLAAPSPELTRAEELHEPSPPAYTPGLGPYRLDQLEADLRLSAEERVKEAEKTVRVVELRAPKWRRNRILTFERYEDYLDWQRQEDRLR